MIAHKEPVVVRQCGVPDAADDLVVKKLDRLVLRKAAAGDHPELDARLAQRVHQPRPVDAQLGLQNHREAEPRTATVLTLDDKPLVAFEQRLKVRGVRPADSQHPTEFLQLLQTHRSGELERAHVIARHDESIGLEERIIVGTANRFGWRIRRNIASPAVIANRAREMIQLGVVCDQQSSLHRRDVMGVKGTEGVQVAERPAPLAIQCCAQRLAVVLEQNQIVRVAKRANLVERGRVAQDAHRHDHARARRERCLELRRIHIERVELDIDEPKLQSVLLQRMKRRRPRDGGNDDLVAALKRALRSITECGNTDQVGRRAGIHHHRVLHAERLGERLFEAAHLLAHRKASAGDDAIDGVKLLRSPARARELVGHQERTS